MKTILFGEPPFRRRLTVILLFVAGLACVSIQIKAASLPLYWTPYEYNYVHDSFIPEVVFKANVDWVASEFLPFGYNTIVTDGWIHGDTAINADGYLTKYSNTWTHDFRYWQKYCQSKGLKLGIYYNPLWIQQSAFLQNNLVKGTHYSLQSIAGPERAPHSLYNKHWVDPSKPGAKEYVQGYVNYFKEMGVNFLRLDFLSEFEDKYGTPAYDKVLAWIREAAGPDMFISLVMPNSYHFAATEVKYGDMMRVSEDTFVGGWAALSGRNRATVFAQWPMLRNAFDGFAYFSAIPGPRRIILDGDALRLNTFADDNERKTAISLYTMAGSPVPIADQIDTIGTSAKFYQNTELLALSREKFVAKPLGPFSNTEKSQIWVGKTNDGAWVVGLFNRNSTPEKREIHYATDLGLTGAFATRDLWSHQELGLLDQYSVNLAPDESRVLKITP